MHTYRSNGVHLSCWICTLVALAAACLLLALPAYAEAPPQMLAAQVVTAPWAAPSQQPGAARPPAETSFVPPPLLRTPAPAPLSEEQRAIVRGTKSEGLAEPSWLRYVVSNEWRHDVVFPRVQGLGGAYVGVATDQNYTVAAAARSELLFLFDYDAEVGRVHRVYHAFMAECPTPAEFRALFEEKSVPRGKEILQKAAPTPKEAAQLVRVYTHYRERLQIYLRHVANLQVGSRRPTWLGDPEAYGYIRSLVQAGRVQTVQGDLNGAVALRSIGETARSLGIPVRIIYTSNAEGFFQYTQAFRENLASLPHDEKSVVLRTYKHGFPSAQGDTWHYTLHQLDDFLARLGQKGYANVHRVMADLRGQKAVDPIGVSYYDGSVPRRK